ncbi:MAG: N-acetylmuramoyl-L-alanine amidase [Robiginitomaculum sp.]|nr:MAG: N-acetylmuramoyl-L-alanine amidase [Robiginitomaculum sp.]
MSAQSTNRQHASTRLRSEFLASSVHMRGGHSSGLIIVANWFCNFFKMALGLVVSIIVCAGGVAYADAGQVGAIRFSGNADQTRIVIEFNTRQEYQWFTLASQGNRLVLDFPTLQWDLDKTGAVDQGEGSGDGVITKYRFAKNSPITSRLVFELAEPVKIVREFFLAPTEDTLAHRLVFDLQKTDLISFIAGTGFDQPFAPSTVSLPAETVAPPVVDIDVPHVLAPSLKPGNTNTKRIVVIDAGHGGKDPGAIGKHKKTYEKNVNLRAALALKKRLTKSGKYQVRLTRATDRFIELEDRVGVARRVEADLFISLHADSAANSKARGASVYTLAERASGRSRREILKGSNWLIDVDLEASRPEVNDILIDLSQRQTKNQSAVFAEILLPKLARVGPLVGNSHRDGNLFVLLAPDVPAVLVEMGFLSNKRDEANLNSKRYINRLTNSIGDAVDAYFHQTERLQASN